MSLGHRYPSYWINALNIPFIIFSAPKKFVIVIVSLKIYHFKIPFYLKSVFTTKTMTIVNSMYRYYIIKYIFKKK